MTMLDIDGLPERGGKSTVSLASSSTRGVGVLTRDSTRGRFTIGNGLVVHIVTALSNWQSVGGFPEVDFETRLGGLQFICRAAG
jgi:hypothetical protein